MQKPLVVPELPKQVNPADGRGFRNVSEQTAAPDLKRIFETSKFPTETKLENFMNYTRRQNITKFLAKYEIFKRILPIKGSIVECGVYRGGGLFSWLHFSSILEPHNFVRKIYGFDTFSGFPSLSASDMSAYSDHIKAGDLECDSFDEVLELAKVHDANRSLGHLNKLHLIKGDAVKTIPQFIEENQHVVVSLLYLDFDLYEPTKVALDNFLPRMPKGSIVCFDELDMNLWPGETKVLVELGMNKYRLERIEYEPYIGFMVI